jgi:lipopolysaccharide transport system permease protein
METPTKTMSQTAIRRTHIKAGRPWWHVDWRDLWNYRDLLLMIIKRDLTAVYKQTILGPLWFVIQPLVLTLVFTVIFGKIARIKTDGVPHIVFYMCATILWNYFQGVLNQGAGALTTHTSVLTKVYFPRLIIPLSSVITNLAHLALNSVIFLCVYAYFLWKGESSIEPNRWIALLPLLIFQCGLMGMGFGLWISSMTIKYRDFRFAMPFITQLWMYATPVVYPASNVVTPHLKLILWLNPMTSIVEFSRYAFTGHGTPYLPGYVLGWVLTVVVFVTGLFMFNRVQRTFVDTI